MKKITIRDFKQLCDANKFHCFIVAPENQSLADTYQPSPFQYDVVFNRVDITLNPDIIKFSEKNFSLQISNIEYIIAHKIGSYLGSVFEICCATPGNEDAKKSLIIILR